MLFRILRQLCLTAVVSTSSSEDVVEWLVVNGGAASSVGVSTFGAIMGRGLVCQKRLEEGSPVLTVPLSLVMSGDSAREYVKTECNLGRSSHLRDQDAISVMLLAEKQRGDESAWATYIRALPETVVTLKSFSEKQLAMLKDDRLAERGRRARIDLEQTYRAVAEPILESCATQFNSFEAYLWARSIIDSRALTFRGSRFLVPVADMVNYQPSPRSRIDDNGHSFLKYHRLDDKEKVMRTFADRTCFPGDQLFEDYGDNPNAVYLEHHGFVPESNPFDCVSLDLPMLTRAHVGYLKALGETGPPSSCIRTVAFDPRRQSLRRYLSVSMLDDDLATRCAQAALASLPPPSGCFVDDDEGATIHQLCAMVNNKMSSDPNESDHVVDDNDEKHSVADRLALQFRRAQFTLLANMSRECEQCLAPIQEKQKYGHLEKRATDFNAWARSRAWPELAIEARVLSSHGGRIGAVATRSIAKQEAYVSVPEEDCLSASTARADPELGPLLETFDDFHALLFLLLREVFLAEKSRWAPYVALLPGVDDALSRFAERRGVSLGERRSEHDSPVTTAATDTPPLLWADDEDDMRRIARLWLRGSQLEDAVVAYLRMVKVKWEQTVRAFRGSPRLQALFEDADIVVSWPIYRWAVQILDSRSIWWSGERHLVPMLDLVNAAGTDDLPVDATVHRTVLDERKMAVTRAAAPFQSDDQVIEDYGQPNHVLFLYHGFALPVNKHDCVRLELEIDIPREDDLRQRLRRRLYAASFQSPRLSACVRKNMPTSQADRVYNFLAVKHDFPPPTTPEAWPSPQILRTFADELSVRVDSYSTLQEQQENNGTLLPTATKILLAKEHELLLELLEEIAERADDKGKS